MLQEVKYGKIICKKVTEDIVYDELFIAKKSNLDHDIETFVMDSRATSHMINSDDPVKI